MNRIPKLQRRAAARIAAATAVAVGAALLAAPGTAGAAVEDVDCAAIGDRPSVAGFEAALETAVACGVEVRISDHSGPYDTYFATPERQVHLVQTADPVADNRDLGPADATLVESGGTLVQANSRIPFTLSGTDTAAPLLQGMGGVLDWNGDQPAPVVSENTAVYEGLADGVDLLVRTEIASADLRFTLDDAEAWQRLSTGLTYTGELSRLAVGTLFAGHTDNAGWDHWAPMTVREANGATHIAGATLTSGALALTLDQAVLDSAAYPLTLTTQATVHRYEVSEWGAVTSAAPELALFRGDGGLDQPYFEAAGQGADAVIGAYCDTLADPACATEHEAAVYWNFWAGNKITALRPVPGVTFKETTQFFSVASADPAACVAPDLHSSSVYRPTTTWATRPPVSTTIPAIAGECRDGRAVYDLTGTSATTALSMHPGGEPARFDGGSAQVDTYFAIANVTVTKPACSIGTATKVQTTSAVTYGDFTVDIWREDLLDPGLTWSLGIIDADTRETVFTTEPAIAGGGAHTPSTVTLPDGAYQLTYQFASALAGYSTTAVCNIRIDTAAPDVISIDVEDGVHYRGDTVTVTVEVSDEGFPDGVNSISLWCAGPCSPHSKTLSSGTTATFEVGRLAERLTRVSITATDKAGNQSTESVQILATEPSNDYNLDGYQDLVTVRRADGALMLHPGKGDGSFGTATTMGTGWNGMDVVMAGDLSGDRRPDLLARDNKTGYLYTYPGDGKGGYGARLQVGPGWNAISDFTSALDFDGNGTTDLIALSERTATLYFYPGDGKGAFGTRSTVATAWVSDSATLDNLTTIGNVQGKSGTPDLLAWDAVVGGYLVFFTDGEGGIEQVRHIEEDLTADSADSGSRYSQVVGGGEYTGDGWNDIYAVDARTGALVRRSYDQNLFEMTGSKTIGTGWETSRLPVADSERAYDFYSDGANEIFARLAPTGELFRYTGDAVGGIASKHSYSDDYKNANLIETAGDFNADGHNDLLVRVASTGTLYAVPGDGQFVDYAARIQVGTGWNAMSAIVSGHDYNGDGRVDLLAREQSTGYLWFYPGNGKGGHGTRVKIGSSWNSMRDLIAPGDLDHDGHADILAIRSADNCVYFYGGRGDGTLESGVQMSCGWGPYDALAAVGDFDNDGHADWIARRTTDGALFLYRGNGAGGYSTRPQIGASGWNAMNLIA
ncbi:VCBS repeat-containing protein [Glycomyces sp. NPDC049804]|uniref:FG-GAP repeat domain-containing protein n=1 Tax=Glycomyces sp. NPDC049804 TaxID=3154363 RepID=UPI003437FF00